MVNLLLTMCNFEEILKNLGYKHTIWPEVCGHTCLCPLVHCTKQACRALTSTPSNSFRMKWNTDLLINISGGAH